MSTASKCPVCHEKYDNDKYDLKRLPCGHPCCLRCVNRLFFISMDNFVDISDDNQTSRRKKPRRASYSEGNDAIVTCPTCRPVEVMSITAAKQRVTPKSSASQSSTCYKCILCKKKKRPVVCHCETCNLFFCDAHSEDHQDEQEDHILTSTTDTSSQITACLDVTCTTLHASSSAVEMSPFEVELLMTSRNDLSKKKMDIDQEFRESFPMIDSTLDDTVNEEVKATEPADENDDEDGDNDELPVELVIVIRDEVAIAQSMCQLSQLPSGSVGIKQDECVSELERIMKEIKDSMGEICREIEGNLKKLKWIEIEPRLDELSSSYHARLLAVNQLFSIDQACFTQLIKPFESKWQYYVTDKRVKLKKKWDAACRLLPCESELECRRTIVAILKKMRGKKNWNGPDSKGNEFNWSESLSLSQWIGVAPNYAGGQKRIEVNDDGLITVLCLNSLGMKGDLPDSVGKLTSLELLDLHDNGVSTLPESIGCLELLFELYIGKNNLELLPGSISSLESLSILQICDNPITDSREDKKKVGKQFEREELKIIFT